MAALCLKRPCSQRQHRHYHCQHLCEHLVRVSLFSTFTAMSTFRITAVVVSSITVIRIIVAILIIDIVILTLE